MSVEATNDPLEDLAGVREIPRWVYENLSDEWTARTWFGRLFYPAYLIDRTMLALFVLAVLSPFALVHFLQWLAWRSGRAWGRFRAHFPATYKEGEST